MTKDRFRFRAWDKSFQKYCENVIVSTINGKITVYGRLVNGNTALIPPTHVVLEQCTGLKDKNGRLIYEGDIVKFYDECYEIFFQDYTAAFKPVSTEGLCIFMSDNEKMEVVGNIHEDPELLEANNDK